MVRLYQADTRSIPLPDESVHCVATSPPYYGLRRYAGQAGNARYLGSEETPEAYLANLLECFREVRRVLRGDGVCWVNIGDSRGANWRSGYPETASPKQLSNSGSVDFMGTKGRSDLNLMGIPERFALAMQRDGWIWRDSVVWAKPSCMPESVSGTRMGGHCSPRGGVVPTIITIAWRPTCSCPSASPVPALVLDPFGGLMSTCVAAQRLGRRSVGLDLSEAYLAAAVKRLEKVPLPLLAQRASSKK